MHDALHDQRRLDRSPVLVYRPGCPCPIVDLLRMDWTIPEIEPIATYRYSILPSSIDISIRECIDPACLPGLLLQERTKSEVRRCEWRLLRSPI